MSWTVLNLCPPIFIINIFLSRFSESKGERLFGSLHEAGSCRNYTLMWFFNSSRRRCSPFWYSGCGGNENRFKTQRECETVCVTPGGREDCEDYVQAWFYDKHIAACTPFWYGGCGGNANRFNTEHECFQTCGTNSKSCLVSVSNSLLHHVLLCLSSSQSLWTLESGRFKDINDCVLVQDPGTCQNYTMMWFFDTEQNECSRFWYGGCGGNENRFKTQEEHKQKQLLISSLVFKFNVSSPGDIHEAVSW
uniref:BPTI/Kunitz inhibitor domain-containing protein n=1 Tax=Seriola dumerili TaxID=41447 RepID=A0A3B4VH40_SERDU